jgi:Tfp pilus assembly protein PilP
MEHISQLVEKENDLKRLLKETRAEIKEEIEQTRLYKQVYETTMQSEYEVTDKTAKAHAFKVVRAGFDDKDTTD